MRGFHKLLQRLSALTGTDYSRFPTTVRTQLTKMFQIYEAKFGEVCLNARPQPASGGSGKATEAWDDIYGNDESYATPVGRGIGSSVSSVASSLTELSSYLDSDTETQFGPDFNILNWWQRHNQIYPILAKDILTVPASYYILGDYFQSNWQDTRGAATGSNN